MKYKAKEDVRFSDKFFGVPVCDFNKGDIIDVFTRSTISGTVYVDFNNEYIEFKESVFLRYFEPVDNEIKQSEVDKLFEEPDVDIEKIKEEFCGEYLDDKWFHKKNGNVYSLVSDKMFVKELKEDGSYQWNDDYVLYKAEYDNPDGPYFVRRCDDFYSDFVKLNR